MLLVRLQLHRQVSAGAIIILSTSTGSTSLPSLAATVAFPHILQPEITDAPPSLYAASLYRRLLIAGLIFSFTID